MLSHRNENNELPGPKMVNFFMGKMHVAIVMDVLHANSEMDNFLSQLLTCLLKRVLKRLSGLVLAILSPTYPLEGGHSENFKCGA